MENQEKSYEGKWGAMMAIGLGIFMGALDMSIINISLPTLMIQLETRFVAVQWIVIAYILIITSAMMGAFRKNLATRQEFLDNISRGSDPLL